MPFFRSPLSPPLIKGEVKGFLPFGKGELEELYFFALLSYYSTGKKPCKAVVF